MFFVRALAGLVRDRASIGVLDVDISETDRRFGLLAGGGVDCRVTKKLAARVQPEVVATSLLGAARDHTFTPALAGIDAPSADGFARELVRTVVHGLAPTPANAEEEPS